MKGSGALHPAHTHSRTAGSQRGRGMGLPDESCFPVQRTVVWEEGPSGELVIVQKLLVPKESHVVSRAGLGGGTLLGRGPPPVLGSPESRLTFLFCPTRRGS